MNEFKEFEIENYKMKKAGVLRKNGAGILDAIIVIFLQNLLLSSYPELANLMAFPNILSYMLFYTLVLFFIYRFLCIFVLGKTIGMAILNMKFAKNNERTLNFKEKILSVVMIYINTIDCYHQE